MSSRGTIYAIQAEGTSLVKIGWAKGTAARRLKVLQTGQPFPLALVAEVPVEEAQARRIERQVHAFLAAEQRRGEWFEVPMDLPTLEALIVRAVQYIDEQEAEAQRRPMQDKPLTLGERVRRCRMALGLSQTAFAEHVGIPVPTLSSIEHGRQSIYAERVVQLATTLGVSTDYLLGGVDDPQSSVGRVPQRGSSAVRPWKEAHDTKSIRKRSRPRKAAPVG